MKPRCPLCAAELSAGVRAAPAAGSGQGVCPACGTSRHVSGPAATFAGFSPAGDIEDAIILSEDPPSKAARQAVFTRRPSTAAAGSCLPSLPVVRPSAAWRTGLLAGLVAVATFLAVMVIFVPGMRAVASARQLDFQKLRTERMDISGRPALMVEGEIINRSTRIVSVPAVRVSLKTPEGQLVRSVVVEPGIAALAPGETAGFRSALASPPAHATQVTLDLAGRSRPLPE